MVWSGPQRGAVERINRSVRSRPRIFWERFLLGPELSPAVNALCLGYVLYRSGLVPRIIPALGLVGAPLLALSVTATLFGVWEQVSVFSAGARPALGERIHAERRACVCRYLTGRGARRAVSRKDALRRRAVGQDGCPCRASARVVPARDSYHIFLCHSFRGR